MTTYGLVRGADADKQRAELVAAGVPAENIYDDWGVLYPTLVGSDEVVVARLDKLGSTMRETLGRAVALRQATAGNVRVLDGTFGSGGEAVIAARVTTALRRRYAADRSVRDRAAAGASDRVGPPVTFTPEKAQEAIRLIDAGATVREVTEALGVSRTALYRHGVLPRKAGGGGE